MKRKYIEIADGGGDLLAVCREVGGEPLWGFMDRSGREVIPCMFKKAGPFSEGLAAVRDEFGSYFINESGEFVFVCNDNYEYDLCENGKIRVEDPDNECYFYVNKKGKKISPWKMIDEPYDRYLSEGLRAIDYGCGDSPCSWENPKGYTVIVERDLGFYNGSDFHDRIATASHTKYGNYGYLDQRGQILVDFVFTNAFDSDKGMLPVSVGGHWGFIDLECNELIPLVYCYSRFNADGIAVVSRMEEDTTNDIESRKHRRGAIDRAGREVIPFLYKNIVKMKGGYAALTNNGRVEWIDMDPPTMEGYAFAFDYDDAPVRKVARLIGGKLYWGFTDMDGQEIVSCEWDDAMLLGGVIRVKRDSLWGLMDLSGKELSACRFDSAFAPYREGRCAVQRGGLWGFVNERGEEVVECSYDAVTDFQGGRSVVLLDEHYGFIDTDGAAVTPLMYDMALPFSEGLAEVWRDGYAGSINTEGKEILPCEFDYVDECSEGLVMAKKGKHWVFYDTEGKVAIDLAEMDIDGVSRFKEGLCGISRDWKWGFIDRSGKQVLPFRFKYPYFNGRIQFWKGLCKTSTEEAYPLVGCFNTKGEAVIPPAYDRIWFLEKNLVEVWKRGVGTGLLGFDGKEIVPCLYDSVAIDKEGKIVATKNNMKTIYSLEGKIYE